MENTWNEELLETKSLGLTLSAKFRRMAAADYSSNSCGINGKALCNIGKRYIKTDIKFILFRDEFKTQQAVPASFYCSKQWQPLGTGQNRRSPVNRRLGFEVAG